MKKILCVLITLAVVLGMCACGGEGGSTSKDGLQVGFSRKVVMPEGSITLAGGDSSTRQSTGYRDEITLTCVAISEGDETILLYTYDTLTMRNAFTVDAENAITEAVGVDADHILMNATHSHAAPAIRDSSVENIGAYRAIFNDAAVQTAQEAIADQSAAELYAGGVQTEGMAFVRHYVNAGDGSYCGSNFGDKTGNYSGYAEKADEELQIIRFARAAEDKKDIILMNIGAHATFNQGGTIISADYPAPARNYIEENSDCMAAVFAGGIGNQVGLSWIVEDNYATEYEAYGQRLGQYVVENLSTLQKIEGTELKLNIQTITKNTCKDGLEMLDAATETKAAGKTYGYKSAQAQMLIAQYGFTSIYEANAIVNRASYDETDELTCATMSIGDLAFVLAPYEMFGVHSMAIKEQSPYTYTFVTSCFENHKGYLPSVMACTTFKSYEYCVTKFEVGTGESMVTEYITMLTDMRGAE